MVLDHGRSAIHSRYVRIVPASIAPGGCAASRVSSRSAMSMTVSGTLASWIRLRRSSTCSLGDSYSPSWRRIARACSRSTYSRWLRVSSSCTCERISCSSERTSASRARCSDRRSRRFSTSSVSSRRWRSSTDRPRFAATTSASADESCSCDTILRTGSDTFCEPSAITANWRLTLRCRASSSSPWALVSSSGRIRARRYGVVPRHSSIATRRRPWTHSRCEPSSLLAMRSTRTAVPTV